MEVVSQQERVTISNQLLTLKFILIALRNLLVIKIYLIVLYQSKSKTENEGASGHPRFIVGRYERRGLHLVQPWVLEDRYLRALHDTHTRTHSTWHRKRPIVIEQLHAPENLTTHCGFRVHWMIDYKPSSSPSLYRALV